MRVNEKKIRLKKHTILQKKSTLPTLCKTGNSGTVNHFYHFVPFFVVCFTD